MALLLSWLLLTLCLVLRPSLVTPIVLPPTDLSGLPGGRCSRSGFFPGYPAESCKKIAQETPDAPSGQYWIRTCSGSVVDVYCEMLTDRCCRNSSGAAQGWMRVANLNMTDPTHVCPAGMFLGSDSRKRLCRRKVAAGCKSIFFPTFFPTYHLPYTRVCGRAVGYQEGTADAFLQYQRDNSITIDDDFLDGMTISLGYPRTHVWSFAASNTEGGEGADSIYSCPCGRTDIPTNGVVPPFVENNYFCESGATNAWAEYETLYLDDPLWDGENCPENSSCCRLNNPPWFCRHLGREFRKDFEIRLCADEERGNEDIGLEILELYVQ